MAIRISRPGPLAAVISLVATMAVLAGCSDTAPTRTAGRTSGVGLTDPGLGHVHGVGLDPADGHVYAATHFRGVPHPGRERERRLARPRRLWRSLAGRARARAGSWERRRQLMGRPQAFDVTADGRLLAADDRGVTLSVDGGERWRLFARCGPQFSPSADDTHGDAGDGAPAGGGTGR